MSVLALFLEGYCYVKIVSTLNCLHHFLASNTKIIMSGDKIDTNGFCLLCYEIALRIISLTPLL